MTKSTRIKHLVVNVLKIVIVAALLAWMVWSGKLDLAEMKAFMTKPSIIGSAILVWLIGPVLLGSWRWWLLVRGAGLQCSFGRAMHLQVIGFFFNTAMPGAVGGDIVKAIYIVRDQENAARKTPAMLSVLLDRIIGLIGLFAMGAVTALFSFDTIAGSPFAGTLLNGLGLVVLGSFVFLGFVFIPYRDGKDPFERFLTKDIPGFSTLLGIYKALRTYRDHPGTLFGTIGISIVLQFIFLGFMGFIGTEMYPDTFDIRLLPPVFPFGVLVTAVPLAPGGLGVGHAAFDKLFHMVGLPGGANVFNIFALSQLALNLLCFVPYLGIKKKIPLEALDQAETT